MASLTGIIIRPYSGCKHVSGFLRAHCGSISHHRLAYRCQTSDIQRHPLCSRRARRSCRISAMMDEGELVPDVDEGTKVKITKEIMVYHAPKIKELQISGMEGVVKNIVKKYKGKETSANLPYRIEFQLEKDDGKTQKFFVHVAASEFEKID